MQRTRIKICGLTEPRQATMAVSAGADAVGVVLAESPRQVSLDEAAKVLAAVPPPVARIGVFVDAPSALVEEAVERLGLTAVQFHGDETPDACAAAPAPVIKAFRVGTGFAFEAMEPYRGSVAAVLLDTYVPRKRGGTGKTIAWHTLPRTPGWAPLYLAGGLAPDNIAEAIAAVRPFAVDVSSGVEARPGVKDAEKMLEFIAAVRRVDVELSQSAGEEATA